MGFDRIRHRVVILYFGLENLHAERLDVPLQAVEGLLAFLGWVLLEFALLLRVVLVQI